ncbi:MAG: BON domain-containing protein [Candidatus Contendobacter sp.]|nr:BON domain-containing protein [Candidatus Contendobacter sp.]MDG4556312.1 BON domain-containing protein [Candidatus Contendobacter sp.]
MNPRKFLIPVLLAALATTGCASLGGGSGGDNATSAASGRGGPTVSDSEITAGVKDAFKQDPELATASITVTVEKGVVSLSGNTPNVQAYLRAGSLARNVPGVRPPVNVSNLQYPR